MVHQAAGSMSQLNYIPTEQQQIIGQDKEHKILVMSVW